MGLREIRERFRGRDFWRGINKFIGVGLYTAFLVGIMAFPMYLGYLILGYVIVIPSYTTVFINHLREMEKKDKGNKVVEGWITHGYGVGERLYLYPTSFEIVNKLSPADLKAVKEYVDTLGEYGKEAEKKTGLGRFKPKQPTYKQIADIEAMSNDERKEFDKDERKELDGFVKDHKNIVAHEKIKRTTNKRIITINGDESKDE